MKRFLNYINPFNMGLKGKITSLMLIFVTLSIVVSAAIVVFKGNQTVEQMSVDHLVSVRDVAKRDIQEYFDRTETSTRILAKDRLIESLFISAESSLYADNKDPEVDNIMDGLSYKSLIDKYGVRVGALLKDYAVENIYLALPDGSVVYSGQADPKGVILGRNLLSGKQSSESIKECFNKANESQAGKVFFQDFAFNKIAGTTMSFLCSKKDAEFDHISDSISKGDQLGVVIVQVDIDKLNNILSKRTGMGKTGQSYLVGHDKVIRSNFFLNRNKFNIDNALKNNIQLNTSSVDAALNGKSGHATIIDPNNEEVISVYRPIKIFGHPWAVISEIHVAEVDQPIIAMVTFSSGAALILIVILGLTSTVVINRLIKPIIEANIQLGKMSDQLSSKSYELSNVAMGLTDSTTQQSEAMEETSASLASMNEQVGVNAQNADDSLDSSGQVTSIAKECHESMMQATFAMDSIKDGNQEIAKLVDMIAQIGEKTKIMDEIVFQTNILSFNASIEAARAGKEGKGFAVVATEISTLANVSGKAAKEIAEIVNSSVKTATKITESNSLKVEEGGELIQNTAKILDQILQNSNHVLENSKRIQQGSQQQKAGIQEISLAVKNVQKTTDTNVYIASQTSEYSDSLKMQGEELVDIVEGIGRIIFGNNAQQEAVEVEFKDLEEDFSEEEFAA